MSELQKIESSSTEGEGVVAVEEPKTDVRDISSRSVVRVVLIVLAVLGIIIALSGMIYFLRGMLFLIILSVFFAYFISPAVDAIQSFSTSNGKPLIPRPVAVGLIYAVMGGVIYLAIVFLAPLVSDQISSLAEQLPTYSKIVQDNINDVNSRFNQVPLPPATRKNIQEKASAYINSFAATAVDTVSSTVLPILFYVPWLILIPILAFFLLKDVKSFRLSILRALPAGIWRNRIEELLHDTNVTMAAYARAQLISCLLIGFVCGVGFYLIGAPYPILFGVMAGIFEFVPLIGPLTIAAIIIIVSSFNSSGEAIKVFIFLAVLRIVHDYVTYPRIIRQGIHLHPLAIILAVLAGEQLAGITGVFLSIPIVAIGTVLFKHITEHRRILILEKENAESEQPPIVTTAEITNVNT